MWWDNPLQYFWKIYLSMQVARHWSVCRGVHYQHCTQQAGGSMWAEERQIEAKSNGLVRGEKEMEKENRCRRWGDRMWGISRGKTVEDGSDGVRYLMRITTISCNSHKKRTDMKKRRKRKCKVGKKSKCKRAKNMVREDAWQEGGWELKRNKRKNTAKRGRGLLGNTHIRYYNNITILRASYRHMCTTTKVIKSKL